MSDDTKNKVNLWTNHMWKIATGICIGFGASQLTIVSQVSSTVTEVKHLSRRVDELDGRTEKRIEYLTRAIDTSIRQNSDALALIREQTSILRVLVENHQKP